MTTVTIPDWNTNGLIPPINPVQPTGAERSPYLVSLLDVVMRFATSSERRKVLLGLLDFRAELHRIGLIEGFQWLDGSFMEQVELLERRPPNDIDVVTFVTIPDNFVYTDEILSLFDHDELKKRFLVDSYVVELNLVPTEYLVKMSAYWYSMWSHRRNQYWKGFLQIDLNPAHDAEARSYLVRVDTAGSW